ncbi:MAG: hypothetical protein U0414_10555 [Polyangiaceae bacterium]
MTLSTRCAAVSAMRRAELLERALHAGLVAVRLNDRALQLVGDDRARHAAERLERTHVARAEVGDRLRVRRLDERVVGRTEHRDEQLDLDDLATLRVDVVRLLAGVVDEHLVAADMRLSHRRRPTREPLAVDTAELRVPISVGVARDVLEVEELERHPRAPQLHVHGRRIRERSTGVPSPAT